MLAVALAVWLGEFGPPPEMNFVQIRLDRPPADPGSRQHVVYPDVRDFPPYDSFQPLPQIDGTILRSCPDFKTQTQAAYFNAALYRKLGLPSPEFTVELSEDERSAIECKVAELMRQRRLAPVPTTGGVG